jgi:hypothetical protein
METIDTIVELSEQYHIPIADITTQHAINYDKIYSSRLYNTERSNRLALHYTIDWCKQKTIHTTNTSKKI